MRVQVGGNTVRVQVRSSGIARANEAIRESAASQAAAAASAASAQADAVATAADRAAVAAAVIGNYTVTNTAAAHTEIQAALDIVSGLGGGIVRIMQPGDLVIGSGQTLVISAGTHLVFGPNTRIMRAANSTGTPSLIRNENVILTGHANIVDEDIIIEGGIWDGNYDNGNTGRGNNSGGGIPANGLPAGSYGLICMLGVRRLTCRNMRLQENSGCAIQVVGEYIDIDQIYAGDGLTPYDFDFIHINGPSRYGKITNVKGWTHDDMVALNAWDWGMAGPCVGDITDFYVGQLWQTAPQVDTNISGNFVRLLTGTRAGTTANIRDVVIEDLFGMISGSAGIQTDPTADPAGTSGGTNVAGTGVIENVTVRNVGKVRLFNSCPMVLLAQANIRNFTLDGAITHGSSVGKLVKITSAADINHLRISRVSSGADAGAEQYIEIKGRVRRMTLTDSEWRGLNSGGATSGSSEQNFIFVEGAAGWIDELIVSNFRQTYGESWLYVESNTTLGPMRVSISGSVWENVKHPFWLLRGTVDVGAVNCKWLTMPNNMARLDGSGVVWSMAESGCEFTTSVSAPVYTRLNSASIRHRGVHMGVNVIKTTSAYAVSAAALGDMTLNTNAALACGAGVVISDGAGTWKNAYSGSTY